MLYRRRFEVVADLGKQRLPVVAFDAIDAHLDQIVSLEASVDLGENGLAEAVLADAGDGIQIVGAGTQSPAFG